VVLQAVHYPVTSQRQSVDQVLHHCTPASLTLAHTELGGLELVVQYQVTWCSGPAPHQMNHDTELYQSQPTVNVRYAVNLYHCLLCQEAAHKIYTNIQR